MADCSGLVGDAFRICQNAEIERLREIFHQRSKEYVAAVKASAHREEQESHFLALAEAGNDYFRYVERAVYECGELAGQEFEKWQNERVGDALNVLRGLCTHIVDIRSQRTRLGLDNAMFEPAPARFQHTQGLVAALRPEEAAELRAKFVELSLPVSGFDKPFAPAPALTSKPNSPKVVIVLHGIRTRGTWQKQLAPLLANAGYIPELLDYGWFSAFHFLIPSQRRKRIDWLRSEYERILLRYPGVIPSVIAHSLGTYLVCRALQVYSGVITLRRVILCGSIVRQDYDWSFVFTKNFVGSALNDCGRLDIWAGNVQRFVSDAGPSGRAGFTTKHDRLVERFHPEWKHSDFFFDLNFEKRWIPYLRGDAVPEAQFEPTSSVPKTLIFLLHLLVGIGIWAFIHFRIGRFFWK